MQRLLPALRFHFNHQAMVPEYLKTPRVKLILCICMGLIIIMIGYLVKEGYVILKW